MNLSGIRWSLARLGRIFLKKTLDDRLLPILRNAKWSSFTLISTILHCLELIEVGHLAQIIQMGRVGVGDGGGHGRQQSKIKPLLIINLTS